MSLPYLIPSHFVLCPSPRIAKICLILRGAANNLSEQNTMPISKKNRIERCNVTSAVCWNGVGRPNQVEIGGEMGETLKAFIVVACNDNVAIGI